MKLFFLVPNEGTFCGNYRVDEGEECDPGDNTKGDPCCDDKCTFKGTATCRYVGYGQKDCRTDRRNQRTILPPSPPGIHLFTCSIYLFAHLATILPTLSTHPPTNLPTYSTYPSIHLLSKLPISLSLYMCLPTYTPTHPPT